MAQDRATPLDPVQSASETRRVLNALRKKREALESSKPQDPYFSYQGKYVAPNYGGMIQGGIDAFQKAKLDKELEGAETADDLARRAMLDSVLNDESEMTTQKLLKLSDAGVDANTLKLLKPDKGLSKGQLYQSLSNNPAMARLALVRGDISQEEYDAVSQGINEERQYKQSLKSGGGGGSSRKETDAEWFRRDPEGYTAYKQVGKSGGSGGSEYDKYTQRHMAKSDDTLLTSEPELRNVEGILRELETAPASSSPQKQDSVLSSQAKSMVGGIFEKAGMPNANPYMRDPAYAHRSQLVRRLHVAASEMIKGQGQVTESEREMLRQTAPEASDTDEILQAKAKTMGQWFANKRIATNAARERRSNTGGSLTSYGADDGSSLEPTDTGAGDGWNIEEVE